jgi:hypothetical protein
MLVVCRPPLWTLYETTGNTDVSTHNHQVMFVHALFFALLLSTPASAKFRYGHHHIGCLFNCNGKRFTTGGIVLIVCGTSHCNNLPLAKLSCSDTYHRRTVCGAVVIPILTFICTRWNERRKQRLKEETWYKKQDEARQRMAASEVAAAAAATEPSTSEAEAKPVDGMCIPSMWIPIFTSSSSAYIFCGCDTWSHICGRKGSRKAIVPFTLWILCSMPLISTEGLFDFMYCFDALATVEIVRTSVQCLYRVMLLGLVLKSHILLTCHCTIPDPAVSLLV